MYFYYLLYNKIINFSFWAKDTFIIFGCWEVLRKTILSYLIFNYEKYKWILVINLCILKLFNNFILIENKRD